MSSAQREAAIAVRPFEIEVLQGEPDEASAAATRMRSPDKELVAERSQIFARKLRAAFRTLRRRREQ
jgi:hypothetical protein